MKAEAYYPYVKHLREYSQSEPERKARFILGNFRRFPKMIEGYESDWKIVVTAEKRYNTLHEMGDLGIRVQTSGTGNPTMNKAIFETELDNAAGKRDLFSVVKGTDDPEQHIREKMVIADMKDDYSIMKNAIHRLEEVDAEVLLRYIQMEKTIQEIADELQMNYDSAKKKLQRLRKEVIVDAAENIRCRCERNNRRLFGNESI